MVVLRLYATQYLLEGSSVCVMRAGFHVDDFRNDGPHSIEQGFGCHTLVMKRYLDQPLPFATSDTCTNSFNADFANFVHHQFKCLDKSAKRGILLGGILDELFRVCRRHRQAWHGMNSVSNKPVRRISAA